jgi:hypothetical protein
MSGRDGGGEKGTFFKKKFRIRHLPLWLLYKLYCSSYNDKVIFRKLYFLLLRLFFVCLVVLVKINFI